MLADTLQVQTGGRWETLGQDRLRGIVPEGITCDSDEWGSRSLSCTLKRVADLQSDDLRAFTPIRYFRGSTASPAWSGFIWDTPNRSGDQGDEWTLNARGWQFHLDDDVIDRKYVHTRLGDWKDTRALMGADLSVYWGAGNVTAGDGALTLTYPADTTFPAFGVEVGAVLDLGPDNRAERVIVHWESSNDTSLIACYGRGCDVEDEVNAAASQKEDIFAFELNTGLSGVSGSTLSTPRRYVFIFLYRASAGTTAANHWLRITRVQVFADETWESANESILKSSDVIRDVRARALPRLLADESQIQYADFSIPDYTTSGYQTPREIITAANAYQGWQPAVDVDRRLVYGPRPTSPTIETNADLEDASANSAEEIYNRAVGEGRNADETPVNVSRTSSDTTLFRGMPADQPTNPSFATNTTGWTVNYGTLTRDTATFDSTPASGRMTTDAGGYSQIETTIPNQIPGKAYTVTFTARTSGSLNVLNSIVTVLNAAETRNLSTIAFTSPGAFATASLTYIAENTTQVLLFNAYVFAASADAMWVDSIEVTTNVSTIPDERGFNRTMVLPFRTAPTDQGAKQLLDLWLATHTRTPSKGSAAVRPGDATRIVGGHPVEPVELLRLPGGLLRFRQYRDPDTGASHRDERVVAVSYDATSDSASVSLNAERGDFQTLTERMAAIAPQVAS